jgi:hypothetical protein
MLLTLRVQMEVAPPAGQKRTSTTSTPLAAKRLSPNLALEHCQGSTHRPRTSSWRLGYAVQISSSGPMTFGIAVVSTQHAPDTVITDPS